MRGSIPFLLLLVFLGACNGQPARRQPSWFGPEPVQLRGEGERTGYRLSFLLRMEYQRQWNQEVSMELDLASWDDGGMRRFVLERPTRPVYTMRTYSQGNVLFPGKKWTVEVKSVVDRDDDASWALGEESGQEAIARWRTRYPDLLAKYEWSEDPKFLFRYVEDPSGRFGFYRTPDGTVALDPRGELDPRGVHHAIETRYRWFKPEKPDEVDEPKLFETLRAALVAFDASPFPAGSRRQIEKAPPEWSYRTSHLVSSVVASATTINPVLRSQLSGWPDRAFEIPCRLEGSGGERRVVCERTEFGADGDLGKGYSLASYRREVVYDPAAERFRLDAIEIAARHKNGDEVRMRISLEAR